MCNALTVSTHLSCFCNGQTVQRSHRHVDNLFPPQSLHHLRLSHVDIGAVAQAEIVAFAPVRKHEQLKVPYYTVFHQYIIGFRYIQNMSLKYLASNTKQIIAASHDPLCFSPVSKVLIVGVSQSRVKLLQSHYFKHPPSYQVHTTPDLVSAREN